MARLIWTTPARRDLARVRRYIARDSPRAAARMASRITRVVDRLADHPASGRIVPELRQQDIREVIVAPYRVIYLLRDSDVRVVMIIHSAQLLDEGELADRL